MTRLLWVTPIAPAFDAGGGGEIRQAHLIDALAERFEVSLLVTGRLRDERLRMRLRQVTEVALRPVAEPPSRFRRRLRDLRWQLVHRQADEVARQAGARRALAAAMSRLEPADIVCVEYIGLAPLLPRRRRGLWSLTLHNLPSQMARHNAAIAPGARQRLMLSVEHRNARRLESWAAGAYDLTVAVSDADAEHLPPGVAVVPNGVDLARFRASRLPDEPRVVFTGALHTLPNRDGIDWFCRQVWPLVRAAAPTATLDVVGAQPPAEVSELARLPGVSIHADVADVAPFLEHSRVAVVPLRIGSGSRLKALEAMAASRPVVGTTIGLGGLEQTPDRDALVADDPVDFAEQVVRCLTDRTRAESLARNGRSVVEATYGWGSIGQRYSALLAGRLPDARA